MIESKCGRFYLEDHKTYMKEDYDIFKNFVFEAPSEDESKRIKEWISEHRKVCKEAARFAFEAIEQGCVRKWIGDIEVDNETGLQPYLALKENSDAKN